MNMAKVQYVGTADVRRISRADFKALDVEHDAVEWKKANGKHQPVAEVADDEALLAYFDSDPGFKVLKEDSPEPRSADAEATEPRTAGKTGTKSGSATGGTGGTGATTTTGGSTRTSRT